MADGYWYHGNGKIGGEFCHIKPNKKDWYGEYVKVVRCKDCKYHEDEEVGMVYCPNIVGGWVREDFYCGNGERKDGGENG